MSMVKWITGYISEGQVSDVNEHQVCNASAR